MLSLGFLKVRRTSDEDFFSEDNLSSDYGREQLITSFIHLTVLALVMILIKMLKA